MDELGREAQDAEELITSKQKNQTEAASDQEHVVVSAEPTWWEVATAVCRIS